ncbi:MAG: cohesin domain-containing protein [Gemmataceae bacterium]
MVIARLTDVDVPTDAPFAPKQVLDPTSLVVQDETGTIPSVADDAVHIAGYFGDNDANGDHGAHDASLAIQLAYHQSQLAPGFVAYPNLDPMIIAEVDGSPDIKANDASHILQEAYGLNRPEIPDIPLGVPSGSVQAPTVSFAKDIEAQAGQTIAVPLNLENTDTAPIRLTSFQFAIQLDAALLSVIRIRVGSSNASSQVDYQYNSSTGMLLVFGSFSNPLTMEPGEVSSLLWLDLKVSDDAQAGQKTSLNLLEKATLDSGLFRTQLNEGNLGLIPTPSDDDDDDVDGWLLIQL